MNIFGCMFIKTFIKADHMRSYHRERSASASLSSAVKHHCILFIHSTLGSFNSALHTENFNDPTIFALF